MPRAKPVRPALRTTLVKAEVYEVRTIKLLFERGWAVFHVDENLGSLSVESDWGNYAYQWGHGGRNGRTLLAFLGTASEGYIAQKLLSGRRGEIVNGDATRRALQKAARAMFKAGRVRLVLDAYHGESAFDLFRSLTGEIREYCSTVDGMSANCDLYVHAGELVKKAFDPLHELLEFELPGWHQFLGDELIPAFQAYLRGEIDGHLPPMAG